MANLIEILSRRAPFIGIGWSCDLTSNAGIDLTHDQQYATLRRDDGLALPRLSAIMAHEISVDVELAKEEVDLERNAELDKEFLTFSFLDNLSGELETLRTKHGVDQDGMSGFTKHDQLRARLAQIRQG